MMCAAPNNENKRPEIFMSRPYFDAFIKLPSKIQKKANTMVDRLFSAPTSAGRNYEKIRDNPSDYYSARVDEKYRTIIARPNEGNVYLFMWIDTHDEAYRWARTHACRVNTRTNCIQVYETMELDEPTSVHISTRPLDESEPLFTSFTDEDLLSISVPEEQLKIVRKIKNRNDLELFREKLPLDAYESLFWLAEGLDIEEVRDAYASVEPVNSYDIESILKTERSQYNFQIMKPNIDMTHIDMNMTNVLGKWNLFLHPIHRINDLLKVKGNKLKNLMNVKRDEMKDLLKVKGEK